MNYLFFLVGVQGSGKSTLISELKDHNALYILKPSTTRSPRNVEDSEYHFTSNSDWPSINFSWQIEVNGCRYGMTSDEINSIPASQCAVTIFDPSEIDKLNEFRKKSSFEVMTIGLDTIKDVEEQNLRVGSNISRKMSINEFNKQRDKVINCDVVLNGDANSIATCFNEILVCLKSRGGVVNKKTLEKFINAGALVAPAHGKISPASYDLRLGDDVWCQGEFINLSNKNPFLKVPAYSYAIVSSIERANLPSFITARFDLKNSLFFKGAILSNGPQIDPGYRGALFCMIYNGSDQELVMRRGAHFSTIEFLTTSGGDTGYRDKYQGKTKLIDFMPPEAATSKGGQILERTEEKIAKVEEEWGKFKSTYGLIVIALIALLLGPSLITYYNTHAKIDSLKISYEDKLNHISTLEKKITNIEEELKKRHTLPGRQ